MGCVVHLIGNFCCGVRTIGVEDGGQGHVPFLLLARYVPNVAKRSI